MIVKIPKDIYSYEHKAVGNFTKRQFFCGLIAMALLFPVFAGVFLSTGSPRLAALLGMAAAMPVLLCGIWKRDGQYLDRIIWYKYRQYVQFPRKRKYVMTNLYDIIRQDQKEIEAAHEENEKDRTKKGRIGFPVSLAQKGHGPKQHTVSRHVR